MTAVKCPPGWNEARVREVLQYYESQSDEEAAAEIEAASESTTMEVPVGLVPAVRELIAKRGRTRPRKAHNKALQRTAQRRRRR